MNEMVISYGSFYRHLCNANILADGRWLEWLDSKIALLINRDGVDPRDYGGKSYEEYVYIFLYLYIAIDGSFRELAKAAEPHIKQEDEGKFRCKTCQKLFRASSFVEKHIANKHPELVKHLDDVRDVTTIKGPMLLLTGCYSVNLLEQFCARPTSHPTVYASSSNDWQRQSSSSTSSLWDSRYSLSC